MGKCNKIAQLGLLEVSMGDSPLFVFFSFKDRIIP